MAVDLVLAGQADRAAKELAAYLEDPTTSTEDRIWALAEIVTHGTPDDPAGKTLIEMAIARSIQQLEKLKMDAPDDFQRIVDDPRLAALRESTVFQDWIREH